MNGTCAGGTGAFIDQMAQLMNVAPEQIDALAARQAVGKLREQDLRLPAAALLRAGCLPARKGQIARDAPDKCAQTAGPRGRDGVPGVQPGVVDALLTVLVVM